ncbi:MAG: glutaredoxin family protein [Vitreoscilla sp.]|nr:glutaredoxin family protein [Polaromonas sp.]
MTSPFIKLIALGALCISTATVSNAQQVYRIVGPDGKVTFSDKPPAETNAKVRAAAGSSGGGVATASLPFELRQIAQKYPVTLYTGENCGPCQSAKTMLINRGIPFAEKTVMTPEDSQALQRLSGENSLPFATIGGQQLKGFSDSEYTQFLNAAGYPATSILPASYRQPAASPMVVVAAAPATNAQAAPARGAAPAPQAAPAAANPSGIRF